MVDAGAGIGNGLPFPAGPLRVAARPAMAATSPAWCWSETGAAGDARGGAGASAAACRCTGPGWCRDGAAVWRADACLAFAGIGRPGEILRHAARGRRGDRRARATFPDHHPYRDGDLAALAAEAQRLGADLVTTEKDAVRLPLAGAAGVRVLPVSLVFDDVEALQRQLSGVFRDTS